MKGYLSWALDETVAQDFALMRIAAFVLSEKTGRDLSKFVIFL
jgi:hypothetical protein